MLTIEEISKIFNIPKGTISSWASNKSLTKKNLLFKFLQVLNKEFVKKVFNRKIPQNVLNEEELKCFFGLKNSDKNLGLIYKFISLLKEEEIKEILRRVKVYNFLKNDDYSNHINDILKEDSDNIEEILKLKKERSYIDNLNINKNLYFKVLKYVKDIKKKDLFRRIKASEIAKDLNINLVTASKYLEIINKYETDIPISTKDIIKKAIEKLKKENKNPTIKNIGHITGLGYGTIQKNLKEIKEQKKML